MKTLLSATDERTRLLMTALAWLLPTALALGALGLGAFLWALRAKQFDDLEGASYRALEDEAPEPPAGRGEPSQQG